MRNSLSIRLLMIFCLLFAQLGGLTHGITHALAEQSQSGDQLPASDDNCDLCDAYAQTDGAIGSNIASFTPGQYLGRIEHHATYSLSSVAPAHFSARAPPYSA